MGLNKRDPRGRWQLHGHSGPESMPVQSPKPSTLALSAEGREAAAAPFLVWSGSGPKQERWALVALETGIWVQILSVPLAGCVTLGKALLYESLFPQESKASNM